MSVRLLTNRLFKHGRYFVQNIYKRNIHINILENKRLNRTAGPVNLKRAGQLINQPSFQSNGLFRFGQHARRLFVDNLLNRVTPTYSTDLRTEATKKLFYGDSAPFFALIGISLASGNGMLTKDDELEGVCWEIREAVSRLQSNWGKENISKTINDDFGLDKLNIGPPIAKGCAAVVYSASIKEPNLSSDSVPEIPDSPVRPIDSSLMSRNEMMMSPIQNTSRFLHNFGGSVDNVHFNQRSNSNTQRRRQRIDSITENIEELDGRSVRFNPIVEENYYSRNRDTEFVHHANQMTESTEEQLDSSDLLKYPLALKMMFNYDIQSNAMAILRAMYKETIPARNKPAATDVDGWEKLLREQTISLPPHPNIVLMFGVFCDQIPNLQQSDLLYPMALPQRLNPNGYGRNMSLFLLMKRYNSRLCDYLADVELKMRTRLLLFAQLLEGVTHLYRSDVAHRDLKSDNILIDLNDDVHPVLVLSDFGCCLADKGNGLNLPFTSNDMDKGGNTALMAPEIITKAPGTFSVLNYTKSDLWACGSIAYEIFGSRNPFYETPTEKSLKNVSYTEAELPPLSSDVPLIVQRLIANILQRNPNKRLSPDIAANVMQLFLWAPSGWLKPKSTTSSICTNDILQWLLSLTTKVLCNSRGGGSPTESDDHNDAFGYRMGRRTYTEYLLISSFLARARLQRIRMALDWIQNEVTDYY